jgi:hypothetical protein
LRVKLDNQIHFKSLARQQLARLLALILAQIALARPQQRD